MQGFQLHTVKYIFLRIELRYRFETVEGRVLKDSTTRT